MREIPEPPKLRTVVILPGKKALVRGRYFTKGDTLEVPEQTAEHWVKTGVARYHEGDADTVLAAGEFPGPSDEPSPPGPSEDEEEGGLLSEELPSEEPRPGKAKGKKHLAIFLAALLGWAFSGYAAPPFKQALNAVTTATASSWLPTASTTSTLFFVYSASTSTSTVLIQQSNDATKAYTVKTISNVGSAGEWWICPSTPYARVNASVVSAGAVSAQVTTSAVQVNGCKRIETFPEDTYTHVFLQSATPGDAQTGNSNISGTGVFGTAISAPKISNLTSNGYVKTGSSDGTLSVDTATHLVSTSTLAALAASTSAHLRGVLSDENGSGAALFGGGTLPGGLHHTPVAYAIDGAISVAPQTAWLTKAGIGAYTLAAPTVTTHDGYVMRIVSTTANAHVVTFASGTINGGSNVTATFGGAVGDAIELEAYQGVWYTVNAPRNVTVAP